MFENFPGFLGYGSIIAIHANWPAYPTGIGWVNALRNIGNFPRGTHFYPIDDIDQAILFLNTKPNDAKSNSLHMATWHQDLIKLQNEGYIKGVKAICEYQWALNGFNNTKEIFGEHLKLDKKGNIIAYYKKGDEYVETIISKPRRNEYGDDYAMFKNFVSIPEKIYMTKKGFVRLEELNQSVKFSKSIEKLVQPFLLIKKYDTAIREVSLFIESRIKIFHNKPKLFGQNLIDYHISELIKQNDHLESAAIKCYKAELKTAFAYVRNEYAHNFKNISIDNCKTIIYRLNDLNNEIEEVFSVYFKKL